MASTGKLIVFEGIDRSGKSTQVRMLRDYFDRMGKKVVAMSFPERTSSITGEVLDGYLKKRMTIPSPEVSHLLFSANRWEHSNTIKQYLNDGYIVIVDRYSYSGIAYTTALSPRLKEWAIQSERELPEPDYLFCLSVPLDVISLREGFGDEVYEVTSFQKKVKVVFDELISNDGGLFKNTKRYIMHSLQLPEQIHEAVKSLVVLM